MRLVITDVDGVLTDNGVYYGERGEVLKRFSIRDGMGVERLRNAGIETAIFTGEVSPSVQRRADKLKIGRCHLGVKDKRAELWPLLRAAGLGCGEVSFIGDDTNDLGLMEALRPEGLIGAPADAMSQVIEYAHFHGKVAGGFGAFREFAEWLLRLRGL